MLHAYGEDFYGKSMAVVVLGYIRPETGFASVGESRKTGGSHLAPPSLHHSCTRVADRVGADELVRRIHTDIEIAREKLKTPELQKFRGDPFFA